MYDLLIFGKWFCVYFLLVSRLYFWTVGALCLYPGHDVNEYISIKYTSVNSSYLKVTMANNTYPEGANAWYYCDYDDGKPFMFKKCQGNGTWKKSWTKMNHKSCSENVSYRCQRRPILGIPITTAQIGSFCLSWYDQINQNTIDNLETACNTGVVESGTQESGKIFYTLEDLKSICKTFWFQTGHDEQTIGSIQFLARTQPVSDDSWFHNLTQAWNGVRTRSSYPKCPFLKCYSLEDPRFDLVNNCDFSQKNWLCKYNISSCGKPSRHENTMITSYGVRIGAVVNYHCQTGYSIVGNISRVCLNTGLWSGEAPKCEKIVDCGPLTNQSSVITYKLVNGTTTLGSFMLCSCVMPADAINGSKYKTCQADGQWHGEEPICQFPVSDNSEFFGGTLEDGEEELLMKIIGGIAGATLVLIALIWLIFSALLYRDKRQVNS